MSGGGGAQQETAGLKGHALRSKKESVGLVVVQVAPIVEK